MNSVQESQMGTQLKRILLLAGLLLTVGLDSSWGQDEAPLQASGQPGDDVVKPAEPVAPIDAKQTEALAWYMKGVEAQENNDPEAALKAFEKATEADPSAPAPLRARAMLLLQSGEVRKGLELAREAIKRDPGDFRTRFQLATILLRKPDVNTIREAIELMNQAVESERLKPTDPEYLLIHSVRGRILLQLNQKAEAAKSYEVLLQALERPEDFDLDFRRHKALMDDRLTGYEAVGEAMLSVGRTDEAVRAFEALVLARGDSPGRHHLLLAMARFRSDDIEKSEASLDAYFASGRREKEALELLAQIYSSTSRSSQLIPKLQELRTDTPDVTVVVLYLAETQLLQGQLDDAAATFESVIVESGDPAGYPGLIRIDIVRADADSLINTLQKALRARVQLREIQPSLPEIINDQEFAQSVVTACLAAVEKDAGLFPEVTWICAQIAQEIEATEEVGKLLQATLDRNPNQEIGQDALQQLGMHHLMNNRFAEAADLFRRLLSLRSLSTESRVLTLRNLAIAEAYNDRIEQALDAIQTALSMFPKNAELLYRLGWIHFQDDNMSAAETALKSAIQKGANAPDIQNNARLLLAAVYSGAKKWEECISQYEEIIASPGQDEDIKRRARLSLSAVHVEQGDNATAEKILEELLVQMPDDPGVNNDLGYLHADQDKNLDQALKMIEIAVAAEPDNQAYLDSLGWVLYRLERHEEALEALLKANSDPGFQDATLQEHLGDVYEALGQHDEAISVWQKALATEQQSDTPKESVVERLKSRLNPVEAEPEATPPEEAQVTP
jgi:tetratricopeptide (TPR) repeat protein